METDTARRSGPADGRIELYVRGLTSRPGRETRERAVTLLERLDAAGTIATFTVRVWGREVGLSTAAAETERGRDILDRVGAVRRWANRNDVSVEPFFDGRAATSEITGEEYTTLRLPVAVLAEYADGDLAYVTPHEDCGTVRTVQDRLDHLAAALPAESDDREQLQEQGTTQRGRERLSAK